MRKRTPKDTLATSVGHVTLAWNEAQFIVFVLFCRLMENPIAESHEVFFSIHTDRAQRDMMVAIAAHKLKGTRLLSAITKCLEKLNKLSGRRNDVTHAMWEMPPGWRSPKIWLPWHSRLANKNVKAELRKLSRELQDVAMELAHYDQHLIELGFEWQQPKSLRPQILALATKESGPQNGRKGTQPPLRS